MGFLGFLRFSLLCLDFLAWPAFALGFPIWASIRAIETDSKYHMKKLVTYWTIVSLISLLEHTFKLIQWVPYWPYMKLIAICWLVIPGFNGACHVYQCVVNPCLSVNLQTVVNWFCWPKEKASIKDTFLTSVETYLKENGSEALEKLIASKGKCEEHHVADAQYNTEKVELTDKNVVAEEPRLLHLNVAEAREDKERAETIEKNAATEVQWVKHPPANLAKSVDKTTIAAEVPKTSMPAVTEEKMPLAEAAVKQAQREWTCALCLVTTTSEGTLNSHLKGKKHKSKSAELKTGKQTAKNAQSSSSRATDSYHANKKPKNCLSGENPKQNTTQKPENAHNGATSGKLMRQKANNTGVVIQHSNLWCGICNIRCCGEIDMAAHLKGRKHLCQIQSWVSSAFQQVVDKPETLTKIAG